MKKKLFALIAAGTVLLSACASNGNVEENGINGDKIENDASHEFYEEMPDISELVNGRAEVINAKNGERARLNSFSENHTQVSRYACLDLDADGEKEYLAEYTGSGDTLIIRKYENELYAYMVSFRARLDLKTDGEMMWSGGASYSGTYRVVFSGKDMEFLKPLESDFDKDVHYIDGNRVSFDEAMRAWNKFDAKENTEWYDALSLIEA